MPRPKSRDTSVYQVTLPNNLLDDLRLLSSLTGESTQSIVEQAILARIESAQRHSAALRDLFEQAQKVRAAHLPPEDPTE